MTEKVSAFDKKSNLILPKSKHQKRRWPDNVAIIGGGRWARVLIKVLHTIAPKEVKMSIHSLHNAKGMEAWVSHQGFENRIGVYSILPNFSSNVSNAVIVVNAAGDHEKSAKWALGQDYPVLVEKPLSLNFLAAQRLANLALSRKIYLATAQVFLFASYVETFSKIVADENEIISINVIWMDLQSYDAGLPVYLDWMPHILSILGTFLVSPTPLCEKIDLLGGGSHLNIHLIYGQIPCSIELVRNGNSRQRIFEVCTRHKKLTLDFSDEPGVIFVNGISQSGDSNWHVKKKPVAKMLESFLTGAAGGIRDARLDVSVGLNANQVIDQIATIYRSALIPWLNNELAVNQDVISVDLRYALIEILCVNDSDSVISIEKRIEYLYRHIKEHVTTSKVEKEYLDEKSIDLIIKQGKASSYL